MVLRKIFFNKGWQITEVSKVWLLEHNAITAGQFTKALVKHHEDYLCVVILNKLCPKYLKNGGKDLE